MYKRRLRIYGAYTYTILEKYTAYIRQKRVYIRSRLGPFCVRKLRSACMFYAIFALRQRRTL
jgi:hypothetical protein